MEVTVKLNNLRRSPTKIRPTLYLVRGKNASLALDILRFTNKGCAQELYKLVKSGIAAAKEREMKEDNLIVKVIKCDQASVMKRHRYGSRGRVARVIKRNSHLTLVISDEVKVKAEPEATKAPAKEAPKKSALKSTTKEVKKDK